MNSSYQTSSAPVETSDLERQIRKVIHEAIEERVTPRLEHVQTSLRNLEKDIVIFGYGQKNIESSVSEIKWQLDRLVAEGPPRRGTPERNFEEKLEEILKAISQLKST